MSEKKVSLARQRAMQKKSGIETTCFRLPEGIWFKQLSVGTHTFDVVPYTVKTGKEVSGGNPMAGAGQLYFERSYYRYRQLGPEQKPYVAIGKTFGMKDPVQEEYRRLQKMTAPSDPKEKEAHEAYMDSLVPKDRQMFLVWDHNQKDRGVGLLEDSYHSFGKLLDDRIATSPEDRGWDLFYFPDTDGWTLEVTVAKHESLSWNRAIAIDFIPRKNPLPDKIVNHGYDLDSFLKPETYERLKMILEGQAFSAAKKEDEGEKADEIPFDVSNKDVKSDSGTSKEAKSDVSNKEPETKSAPMTADQAGLEVGSLVVFKEKKCEIHRISKDGTSLKLIDMNDSPIEEVVGVADVKIFCEEPKKPTEEDAWDAQWDKEPKKEPAKAASSKEDW